MHILQIETFGRGGLTHYVYNLSCALAERGHVVSLATSAAYELEDLARRSGSVELHQPIGRLTGRVARFDRSWVRKAESLVDSVSVLRLARRLKPDVIHLHCTNPVSLAYLVALRGLGRPVVSTAHVVTPHEAIRFQGPVYHALHRLSDLTIAHSRFDRTRLLTEFELAPERVVVIPHGDYRFFEQSATGSERASARRWLGLAPDEEVALFFGYIREYKGLDLLLEAWSTVVQSRPRARLVVAGDPVQLTPERAHQLERWATRLGAIQRLGYIPFSDVARYFSAADVLVMPYRHISQSGVLLSALSLGVPVVAARVGLIPEMLRDGHDAVLVSPESPVALAEALIRVLRDPELRRRLRASGLRVAARYAWPVIAEKTEEAFTRLSMRRSSK